MFKTLKPILALSLYGSFLLSSLAQAEEKALISKTNYSGYTRHDYASNINCQLFSDHVLITHHFGGAFTSENRPLKTAGIPQLIALAAREKLQEEANNICDAPSTSTEALLSKDDGSSETLVLFSTGGCGHKRQTREGGAAYSLRSLIDSFCPKTH
jgi:hypothetical protein